MSEPVGWRENMASAFSYPTINRFFTFALWSTPPLLGSVASFVWHGGALWCVKEIAAGRKSFATTRAFRITSILLLFYGLMLVVSFLANSPSLETAPRLLPAATPLLFPFSYSIWAICDRDRIAHAISIASCIACLGAFSLAIVEFFVWQTRPEGGAGNSLVFAVVTGAAACACLGSLVTLHRRYNRVVNAIIAFAATCGFGAVVLSESRSLWVACLLAILGLVLPYVRLLPRIPLKFTIGAIALLAALGTLSIEPVSQRFGALAENFHALEVDENYDTSLGLRVALFDIGMQKVAGAPLLGSGIQNTRDIIAAEMWAQYELDRGFTHFHNGFLTAAVEAGTFGATALLLLLLFVGIAGMKTLWVHGEGPRALGGAILVSMFCIYALGGSFNMILGQDLYDTMFMIMLISGCILAFPEPKSVPDASKS
ncbi:O-antigen ligase family protein [Nitratireductor basaltis]|uniref:O-antigen polymerase n=1 Tax=Nitratireductor basaltis TaxID=472175 RepID=A0A084UB62_9HYPH|nr:O-antigen ligase family protein [Nitratireductor basaltis]KFB10198.1 O-antigen polymerase [Nitratireductor basaltis]